MERASCLTHRSKGYRGYHADENTDDQMPKQGFGILTSNDCGKISTIPSSHDARSASVPLNLYLRSLRIRLLHISVPTVMTLHRVALSRRTTLHIHTNLSPIHLLNLLRPMRNKPAPLKQGVEVLDIRARDLGHDKVDVEEADEAPGGEEEEGAPVVRRLEQGRHELVHAEEEEPVEGLAERCAEGSNAVRPDLGTEDVGKDGQAYASVSRGSPGARGSMPYVPTAYPKP